MLRLLAFLSIISAVHGSCPDGFDLVRDGQCRGKYSDMTSIVYDQVTSTAISKCKEIQAQPIIIHNEEENSYWMTQAQPYAGIIIGVVCNTNTLQWEWADGSPIDFKPPSGRYNSDLDRTCKTGCMWLLYPESNPSLWWSYGCSHSAVYTTPVFCITQPHPPHSSQDGCEGFADDSDDGICYQIGAAAENWQDAQMICKALGADLASIHNLKENNFVRRLAVSKGEVNALFLGATISGKANEFGWIDGSVWDYDNFYSGFPMKGLGDCVAMDTQGISGEWVNTDCSSKMSVACIRKQNTPWPVCYPGPWIEKNVIVTPGFPFDASMPCDFMLNVAAGKKVLLEVFSLEANSCCDHLVLFDNYILGNVIANLTGEISKTTYTSSTNFMRVSWQPNGGVNVRGVMMTYRAVL